MKQLHRTVVAFGVSAMVALAALAGSVAQASNPRGVAPKAQDTLRQKIQQTNADGGGCRE